MERVTCSGTTFHASRLTFLEQEVLQPNPERVAVGVVIEERRVSSERAARVQCHAREQVQVVEIQTVPEELRQDQMLLRVN